MIKLQILDKQYELPDDINNISSQLGSELLTEINTEENANKEILYKRVISIVTGCSIKELKSADIKMLEATYQLIKEVVNYIEMPMFNILEVDGKYYKLKDIDNMNTEDYIKADFIISEASNMIDAGIQLIHHFYEPIKNKPYFLKGFKMHQAKGYYTNRLEKYKEGGSKVKLDVFREFISAGYASVFLNIIYSYKQFKQLEYPIIFKQDSVEKSKPAFGKAPSVAEMWGWYHILDIISNGNVNESDNWLNKPIDAFMTYVCYFTQKNNELNNK